MRCCIILLILVYTFGAKCQLSTSYVENWIKSCEPDTELDHLEWLCIINGVPFDKPEEELNSFDTKNQRWFIDYVNTDSIGSMMFKPNMLLILIGSTPKTKRGERRKILHEFQMKFVDEFDNLFNLHPNPADPVLILNGKLILPEHAGQTITDINAKNIRYIQFVNHTAYALYGHNAKNGAVTIWTRNALFNSR